MLSLINENDCKQHYSKHNVVVQYKCCTLKVGDAVRLGL